MQNSQQKNQYNTNGAVAGSSIHSNVTKEQQRSEGWAHIDVAKSFV